ncbi:hypothetical protein BWZ22_01195 [Seonamhaeicola sp. S2-3]|uniref:hypothetical protein n=1 Tax=Seonamhaeicola sp. S2-3 TaxID=1936081 RepID=UPI00097295CE|nr:hypothetical protein [Seonamhaeicola sp. S2-3]APY09942.1 hypothetical protein BWZ22_01195 [Seonamhaeicola sp. S2-3]
MPKNWLNKKEKAATLEKKAIITKYKDALSLNIETYNRVLKQYGSSFEILPPNTSEDELLAKNKEEITDYFLTHIKEATNSYLAELNNM